MYTFMNFVEAIRINISKLYELYVDLECKFKDEVLINAFPYPLGWKI